MAISTIPSAGVSADTLTAADLAPNSVDSSELVDGAVDLSHMSANSIDSDQFVDGSIDAAHLHTNAVFASGVKMIFQQTAAPTGWTKVTGSGNDNALRITTGTVGTGGSVAFETAFASVTPTITMTNAAITLDASTVPNHGHSWYILDTSPTSTSYPIGFTGARTLNSAAGGTYGTSVPGNLGSTSGGGSAHTHTNSAASSAVNLDVSYVDVIIATKD